MIMVYIAGGDAALLLSARRALEPAGFAVRDAADLARTPPGDAVLVVGPASADLPAIARRYPAARILAIGGAGELRMPFTASELLAAVRLTLARGATTGPRRRSPQPPRRPA